MARVCDVPANLVRIGGLVQTGNGAKQRPILQSFSAFGGRGPQRIGRNGRRCRQSGVSDLYSKSLYRTECRKAEVLSFHLSNQQRALNITVAGMVGQSLVDGLQSCGSVNITPFLEKPPV